jgi:DNA-binding GntR family transcriptional regulator
MIKKIGKVDMMMGKDSLRDVAYEYLCKNIISNKLTAGHVIVEQEISDILGISRTPIREALKQLTDEGLVTQIHARGTFVKEISTGDVEEIFEIREMFEEDSLKWAISQISDEDIVDMESTFNTLNDNSSSEDFYNSDRKLHDTIIRHGHNKRMIDFLNTVNAQLERLRRISSMSPNRLEKSKMEHIEIIRSIKERNLEKAVMALHVHLENVKNSILTVCKQDRINI